MFKLLLTSVLIIAYVSANAVESEIYKEFKTKNPDIESQEESYIKGQLYSAILEHSEEAFEAKHPELYRICSGNHFNGLINEWIASNSPLTKVRVYLAKFSLNLLQNFSNNLLKNIAR